MNDAAIQQNDTSLKRKGFRACAFAVMLLALSSCTTGPDYKRPELDVPAAYKGAEAAEAPKPQLDPEWWHLFGDTDLNAIEEEALQANQQFKAAMARVTQARASASGVASAFYPVIGFDPSATRTRRPPANTGSSNSAPTLSISESASSGGLPSISITGSGSNTRNGGTSTSTATLDLTPNGPSLSANHSQRTGSTAHPSNTSNQIQIPFDLNYEIDIWGKVRRSYEAAKAELQASTYDLEVVRQTLLADVAQNYFDLRALDNQDKILAHNVDLYREQVALTDLQYKTGIVSETNVLQAKALLDSTIVLQIENRRQRTDLEHAIAILLGRPVADYALPVRQLDMEPPKIPEGLPADLLRARPDVAEAEANLAASNAQIGVAMAAFYPSITLSGAAGFESIDIQHALDWKNRVLSFGPSVALPIFNGGKLKADLRVARAKNEELTATYRNSVLTAFGDVENSLTDLHSRADEAAAQQRAVESARGYRELTVTQYRNGLANYLQVIDAERTVLSSELSAAQIWNQRMDSTVLFIKSLGGGWQSPQPTLEKRLAPLTGKADTAQNK